MTHKIFDANDRANEEHAADPIRRPYRNHRERMRFDFNTVAVPPFKGKIAVWNGEEGNEHALPAYISGGRWLAKCECGGVENVTADDPIFFCHECGNRNDEGKSRPVIFPETSERKRIERDLMKILPELHRIPVMLPPSQQSAAACVKREWRPA